MKHELTYAQYVEFVNHLFLGKMLDVAYTAGSTVDALTIVEQD